MYIIIGGTVFSILYILISIDIVMSISIVILFFGVCYILGEIICSSFNVYKISNKSNENTFFKTYDKIFANIYYKNGTSKRLNSIVNPFELVMDDDIIFIRYYFNNTEIGTVRNKNLDDDYNEILNIKK